MRKGLKSSHRKLSDLGKKQEKSIGFNRSRTVAIKSLTAPARVRPVGKP